MITRHAAHTGPGQGWDLETLDVVAHQAPVGMRMQGFAYSHGYVKAGVQYDVYTRKLPFSPGTCPRCEDYAPDAKGTTHMVYRINYGTGHVSNTVEGSKAARSALKGARVDCPGAWLEYLADGEWFSCGMTSAKE